jgi:ABC-type glycerol-3-phosphate transport system substrate-binding protein
MFSLKRFVSVTLVVSILATVFLTSCRTKDPGPAKKDYSDVELTYYKVFDESSVIKPMIDAYIMDHPGLTINYRQFSDFDEYQNTILNEMAEGEGPDIFSMQNTWFAANFRKLAPMPKDFGGTADFEETFVDVAYKDLVRVDDEGEERVFALPMTVDTLALYYNKAHFEDRLPTKGRPSSTWEGIKEDVAALNKVNNGLSQFEVSGIAMGRADNISRAVDIFYLLFLQYGGEFYNDNMSQAVFAGKHGGSINYPALEALEFYTSFADSDQKHYSWNEFVASDDNDAKEIEAFAAGDVSMIIGYSYMYDEILDQIDSLGSRGLNAMDEDDIRIAQIPQLYDPEVSKDKRVTYANYFAETVSKNSEHPDVAWDFLIHMTSYDNLQYYFEKLNKPTSRRDMINGQKEDPKYGVFAEQIGFAESFPMIHYYTYKSIFTDVINKAASDFVGRAEIGEAQDLINGMLPIEGLINPKKEPSEDEKDETESEK